MKIKIDLHVHSYNSGDNDADPEETIDRAIELGLHGIAFTEHYSYSASEPVERLREKYGDAILLFRGVEFSAAEGHCSFSAPIPTCLPSSMPPGGSGSCRSVSWRRRDSVPSFRGANSAGELLMAITGIADWKAAMVPTCTP